MHYEKIISVALIYTNTSVFAYLCSYALVIL